MPAPERWGHFQSAVLWPRLGYDGYGQPVVDLIPRQIRVRWDDTYRQVATKDGTPTAIEATVSTNLTFPVGSLLWLGQEIDLPATADIMEVHSVNVTPDLKNRVSYKEYQLKRWKGTIGTTGNSSQ